MDGGGDGPWGSHRGDGVAGPTSKTADRRRLRGVMEGEEAVEVAVGLAVVGASIDLMVER